MNTNDWHRLMIILTILDCNNNPAHDKVSSRGLHSWHDKWRHSMRQWGTTCQQRESL